MFGRTEPWEVWGPSSEKPELGLNASIAGLRQVNTVDHMVKGKQELVISGGGAARDGLGS